MSTNKFQYWPSNGQLGSTKFPMPTTAEDWPSGDALIGNFVYSEGKLVDFIDIKGLTPNTSKSTTIPYDYVNIELPFAEDAMTINRGPRNKYFYVTFNENAVEGINGDYMLATSATRFEEFTPITLDEINSVDANTLVSANGIFDGRSFSRSTYLPLFELAGSISNNDKIPMNTSLGVVFGGNIENKYEGDQWNGEIWGEYYIRYKKVIDYTLGPQYIDINGKTYRYEADGSGKLYIQEIVYEYYGVANEDNAPYLTLVWVEEESSKPKPDPEKPKDLASPV